MANFTSSLGLPPYLPEPADIVNAKGHTIPPHSQVQLRWRYFYSKPPVASEVTDFDHHIAPKFGESKEAWQPAWGALQLDGEQLKTEPEQSEAASRIYRAAIALVHRYRVHVDGAGDRRTLQVFGRDPLIFSLAVVTEDDQEQASKNISPQSPTDEIKRQIEDADLYLLWAVKGQAKDHTKIPYTCLLIDIFHLSLGYLVYEAKSLVGMKRPGEFNQLKPTIDVPEHSSWPAGHAHMAGMVATLLDLLTGKQVTARLGKAATRIADNRKLVGLHTDSDNIAGLKMGAAVMAELLQLVTNNPDKLAPKGQLLLAVLKAARYEWK